MRKLKKGFTIVELIIVIAVMAVLAAVLIPTFVHLSKKAKEVSDKSLVANLNTALKMEENDSGKKPSTMFDAVEGLKHQGYLVPQLVTKSDQELVYNIENNSFYLSGDVEESLDYWHIQSKVAENQKYSIYAFNWEGNTATVGVGFDQGEENLDTVAYQNSTNQNVLIRTNDVKTALSISDTSTGNIKHYGTAGQLNIIQCHTSSYHENGKVAFAEIAKGRIVLENGSDIDHIHVNKKNSSSFDTVIIENSGAKELPETITRDQVTVSEATVVVQVVSSSGEETVYVYANGDVGSTQKVNEQNVNVTSELGLKVIDNGSAGKNALDSTPDEYGKSEKDYVKEEAVETFITNEVLEEAEAESKVIVARIGNVGYESFKEALKAVKGSEKIVLLEDIELDDDIVLSNELLLTKDTTISLNGYTLNLGVRLINENGHYGYNYGSINAIRHNVTFAGYGALNNIKVTETIDNAINGLNDDLVLKTLIEYQSAYPDRYTEIERDSQGWSKTSAVVIGFSKENCVLVDTIDCDAWKSGDEYITVTLSGVSGVSYSWASYSAGASSLHAQIMSHTDTSATVKPAGNGMGGTLEAWVYCDVTDTNNVTVRYLWVFYIKGASAPGFGPGGFPGGPIF